MLKRLVTKLISRFLGIIYRIKTKIYFNNKMKYILEMLNKENITDIERFKEKNWHNGYCYFKGVYKKKEVFIKVDLKLRLLENEKIFYDFFAEQLANYLTPMYIFRQNKYLQMIVYSFLSNSNELNKYNIIANNSYLDEIICILDEINKLNIIHRDIKLDNFMLEDKKIKIIDFTFSRAITNDIHFKELDISKEENYEILKRLGNGLNPKSFVWNDFFSMKSIIDNIIEDEELTSNESERLNRYSKYLDVKSIDKSYTNVACLNRQKLSAGELL